MFFGCVVISDLYLLKEIVLLNPCFIFSKNLVLSLIDKVTTGTWSLALFILNVAPVVYLSGVGGLPAITSLTDISDTIHSFDHDKSISM